MSDLVALRQMGYAIDHFREAYADMSGTTLSVFLIVATNPAISAKDLLKRIPDTSQSAISRHLSTLGEWNWRGGPGLGLVDLVEDPEDRRNKIAFLSAKGKQLAIKMARALDPKAESPDPDAFPTASEYVRSVRYGAR